MGERNVPMHEVDKSFTGIALELSPTTEFQKKDERVKLGISAFWTNIEGLVPSLTKLFVLSLLLQFFMLAPPHDTQLVVDGVLVSQDKPLLVVLAIGFGLLVLIQAVTQTFRSWVVLHLGAMMSLQMATNLMRHLVHLPLSYFDKRHMGDVVSRFGSLSAIRDLFTKGVPWPQCFHSGQKSRDSVVALSRRPVGKVFIVSHFIGALFYLNKSNRLITHGGMPGVGGDFHPQAITARAQSKALGEHAVIVKKQQLKAAVHHHKELPFMWLAVAMRPDIRVWQHTDKQPLYRLLIVVMHIMVSAAARAGFGPGP